MDHSKESSLKLIKMTDFAPQARVGCVLRVTPDSDKRKHFLTDKWGHTAAWVTAKSYFDFENKRHRKKKKKKKMSGKKSET